MSDINKSDTSTSSRTGSSLSGDVVAAAAGKAAQGLDGIAAAPPLHDPHAHASGSGPAVAGLSRDAKAAAGDAKAAAGDAADKAADIAGQVRDKAADLADQARDKASALADDVRGRLGGAADDAKTWVSGVHQEHMRRIDDAVVRGSERLDRGRGSVEQFVTENPLLVGVVGIAAGLLLGALLPRTRQEDRNIGPYADEVRDQGLRYAREFTSRGREFVETALDPDNIQAAAQKAASPEAGYRGDDRAAPRT